MRFEQTKTTPLARPHIMVKVHDDGDIELNPTEEPAGISSLEQLLVYEDYNKLTDALIDYGAVEPNIMEAIIRIRGGERDVIV